MNKKELISSILFLFISGLPGPVFGQDKMDWWRDDKFGMFIHWGIYAVRARGEWIMVNQKIPVSEYELLAEEFNPSQFDAEAWVDLASQAGMRYLVFTSKHHDGFCMWNTDLTDYDVVDRTPFARDVVAELSQACMDKHIKFGVYYSINDWHHPDAARPQTVNRYIRNYMFPQVTELIQNYPISILWFDGDWQTGWTDEDAQDLYELCVSLNPDIIVNDRIKRNMPNAGDYITPEQVIPDIPPGRDWESCMTINTNWGYHQYDSYWKTSQRLIRYLLEISSKGGNFLLNIGPTADGVVPQPSVDVLREMGQWLDKFGQTVYHTRTSPVQTDAFGRVTYRDEMFYPHVWKLNVSRIITIPYQVAGNCAVELLTDGTPLPFTIHSNSVSVNFNAVTLDPPATTLRFQPLDFITADAQGRFLLNPDKAHLRGDGLCVDASGYVGCWTEGKNRVFWRFKSGLSHNYEIMMHYAADPCCAGKDLNIRVNDQIISHTTRSTGGLDDYLFFSIDSLSVAAGWTDLIVEPAGGEVPNIRLKQVALYPRIATPEISEVGFTMQNHFRMSWDEIAFAQGYHVYRDTVPGFVPDQSGGSNRVANSILDQEPDIPGIQWIDTDNVKTDQHNYYYRVSTVGFSESAPSNEYGLFKFELTTTDGTDFTHVAFPVEMENLSDAASLLNAIDGCNSIARWDAIYQGYQQYLPELPASNFSLSSMSACFVNVVQKSRLMLSGPISEPAHHLINTNTTSFNEIMVPLYRPEITSASILFDDIPYCNGVAKWDVSGQCFLQYVPGLPGSDFRIQAGHPCLVSVTENGIWPSQGTISLHRSLSPSTRAYTDAPHLVWGKLEESLASVLRLSFRAFIADREEDDLTESSPGCGIQDGFWRVQCSTFRHPWKAGERLIVRFYNSDVESIRELEIPLSYHPDNQVIMLSENETYPSDFYLSQNYPNPFNSATTIQIAVAEYRRVRVCVYDIQGKLVRILKDSDLAPGFHELRWDGRDRWGYIPGNGVYIIQMETGDVTFMRKALFLK